MLDVTSSSLQTWLSLDQSLENLPRNIRACYNEDGLVDCAEVCTSMDYLDTPWIPENFTTRTEIQMSNLNTCGLYTAVALISRNFDLYLIDSSYRDSNSLRFQQVGLNVSNVTQVLTTLAIVATYLVTLFDIASQGLKTVDNYGDDDFVCLDIYPSMVSSGEGVHLNLREGWDYLATVHHCVNDICAPRQLNEDLAGIGVSSEI